MQTQKLDLSSFKRDINLPSFAATYGYAVDRKKTTKTSIAMKSNNDKTSANYLLTGVAWE